MAVCLVVLLHISWVIMSTSTTLGSNSSIPSNENVHAAVKEMQGANYFTFGTLINMVQEKIPGNSTLLMPDDQLLSDILIPEDEVIEFISRHLIPSRLLLHHLADLPNRTVLPTNKQGYMLTISSNGRTKFLLNNVKLVHPDICVAGTIACHGINGVLTGNGATCSKKNHVALGPSTYLFENSTGLAILASRNVFSTVTSCMILLLLRLVRY